MTSVHSSSLDADEVDLSGLVESVVDSDEEDMVESIDVSNSSNSKLHFSILFQMIWTPINRVSVLKFAEFGRS